MHKSARAGNLCARVPWWRHRARLSLVRDVEVDFAVRDGESIAYVVFGDGPIDLVVQPANRFPIDLMWDLPQLAEFMGTLGTLARVIVYDPRGYGASDPLPTTDGAAGVESGAADLIAVLDAVRAERPSVFDLGSGGSVTFFAATYPERVRSLILNHIAGANERLRGFTTEQRKKMARALSTTRGLRSDNPRVAHDPVLQQWWGRARRLGNSPAGIARSMEYAANIDIESVLGHIRVPTLVLARTSVRYLWDVETSRAAAARIPNSRFVELPGSEVDLFLGDTAPVLAEIAAFLRQEVDQPTGDDRPLATVLFTDIVSSTERLADVGDQQWRHMLDDHDGAVNRTVSAYRGRVIKTLGDGVLATFDGPARAVHCAAAIQDALAEQGIVLRAGLHTGEIEIRGDDVTGLAVHIASRVSALAGPREILVSRTVVDLTSGSGITYDQRGEHELKGIPGHWPVFVAHAPATTQ
jgi:class 3 adenylate cyclase